MPVTALQTNYKGYAFRSRLEARMAVILDELGWTWSYEPEGFSTAHGNYLPDFRISYPYPMWIEVKGQAPTEAEKMKLREVANATQMIGVFFVGTKSVSGLNGETHCYEWHTFPQRWRVAAGKAPTEGHDPFEHTQFPKGWLSDTSKHISTFFSIEFDALDQAFRVAKAHRFGT